MGNRKYNATLKFKDPSDFPDRLREMLAAVGRVKVGGVGVFEVKPMRERTIYNIGKRKKTKIPGWNKIRFRPEKKLFDAVQ